MKRTDLLKELGAMGRVLLRHGKRHDWYHNPGAMVSQPDPRHAEIKDTPARHIL